MSRKKPAPTGPVSPDRHRIGYLNPTDAQRLLEILDDEPDAPSSIPCPQCHGPLMVLGKLGHRVHMRCRNCGLEISTAPDGGLIP